jgi:hypothetical protein
LIRKEDAHNAQQLQAYCESKVNPKKYERSWVHAPHHDAGDCAQCGQSEIKKASQLKSAVTQAGKRQKRMR